MKNSLGSSKSAGIPALSNASNVNSIWDDKTVKAKWYSSLVHSPAFGTRCIVKYTFHDEKNIQGEGVKNVTCVQD